MAERIVGPGVFTNEYDQSFLPTAIGNIGAAFVGPTSMGPAFTPTIVTSYSDFTDKFGGANDDTYLPYSVKAYLENTGTATIVRVCDVDGYENNNIFSLVISSSIGSHVVATFNETWFHNEKNYRISSSFVTSSTWSTGVGQACIVSASAFNLIVSGGAISQSYTVSLNPSNANWIGNMFGTSPKATYASTATATVENYKPYLYTSFEEIAKLHFASSSYAPKCHFVLHNLDMSGTNVARFDSNQVYSQAATPWINSQLIGGNAIPLFRFGTINHGNDVNKKYKISITSVKRAGELPNTDFGSFSVLVRTVDDNDKSPNVLESFNDVNLDPNSSNYIARIIGDKYAKWDTTNKKLIWVGDYVNKSKYVFVDVDENVKNGVISPALVPWGHAAIYQPVAVTGQSLPSASMVTSQVSKGEYNSKIYHGFNFDFDNTDNENYLMAIDDQATAGFNAAFNMDNLFVHPSASTANGAGLSMSGSTVGISVRKFSVPFQGGTDALNPSVPKKMGDNISITNTMGFDLSTSTTDGSKAYQIAVDLLSNQDAYDINAVFTPGVLSQYHSSTVDKFIDMCESRGDCFYVFDNCQLNTLTLSSVTDQAANYDTNYAATYYPWIKIFDAERNKYVWVPPSVVVAGALSYNDRYGFEWFAPAGLNRGALSTARDVYNQLTQPDINTLYEARVNPIAQFPNAGIVVWGQKTLQVKASALDRINVRRLMINVKKFIASTSKYLVFENNTSATRNKFLSLVNPYLESIQQKSGLYAFKVIMDETNNTPDVIDRNILYGQLYIQPSKTAEFIIIDLNVMPTGAEFATGV